MLILAYMSSAMYVCLYAYGSVSVDVGADFSFSFRASCYDVWLALAIVHLSGLADPDDVPTQLGDLQPIRLIHSSSIHSYIHMSHLAHCSLHHLTEW